MKKNESPERIYPELNLEKWSIWQPANSRNQLNEIVIKRIVSSPDGSKTIAEVEVSANSKYGPLNTEDQKVYYALMKLWQENGRSTELTSFSIRRLAKILNRGWGSNVAESIRQSLYRLRFSAFIWKNSYYNSATKETVKFIDTFNILAELKIAKKEADGTVNAEVGYFRFHDLITQNLLNGYIKPLLLDQVIRFKTEIGQMLYHYLDLVMADKTDYWRRTEALFFDDLQLKGEAYKKPSHRKRKLEKAIQELPGAQLTTGIIASSILEKTKDGKDYNLVVHKTSSHSSRKPVKSLQESNQENKPDRKDQQPVKDQRSLQAEKLVRCFYNLFHPDVQEANPSQKEISQAQNLITQHGFEKASYVVDFSYKAAQKTKYDPQTFGGIIHYAPKAMVAFERREKEHHQRQAQTVGQHEKQAVSNEEIQELERKQELERLRELVFNSLSPDERAQRLQTKAAEAMASEHRSKFKRMEPEQFQKHLIGQVQRDLVPS